MQTDPRQTGAALPVSDLLNLRGRVALVTGASGGIGRAIALRLAEAGATLALHFHSQPQRAAELAFEIEQVGGRALAFGADLSAEASVAQLFADVAQQLGPIDILVNNAALQTVAALDGMTLASWRQMLAANLDSVFLTTQQAAQMMSKQAAQGGQHRHACIVNIASIEALAPAAGHAHYATAKAAVLMFTRAAALEFGPLGVRVNAVSPGLIHRDGLVEDWPDGVQRWQANAPLGRLGEPADVADAVLFLCSDAARWISGSNLVVDGGVSAHPPW